MQSRAGEVVDLSILHSILEARTGDQIGTTASKVRRPGNFTRR